MAKEGWVSVHRKIEDCWVWKDKPFSYGQAWIDLLIIANHADIKKPYKGKIVVCKRGCINRSILSIANRWGWSRAKVKRFLDLLKADEMIDFYSTTHDTTITIIKYDDYQHSVTTNDTTSVQPANNKRTTNEQQTDTNNNVNKNNNVNNNNNNSCASNDDTTDIKEQEERAVCVDDICFENFEKIYAIYPLKKGKQDAYRHYTAWGKGTHACDGGKRKLSNKEMYLATKRYVDEMRELEKLDYLKHFSTFMNNGIVDYLIQNKEGD
jgi:hypothetical protein